MAEIQNQWWKAPPSSDYDWVMDVGQYELRLARNPESRFNGYNVWLVNNFGIEIHRTSLLGTEDEVKKIAYDNMLGAISTKIMVLQRGLDAMETKRNSTIPDIDWHTFMVALCVGSTITEDAKRIADELVRKYGADSMRRSLGQEIDVTEDDIALHERLKTMYARFTPKHYEWSGQEFTPDGGLEIGKHAAARLDDTHEIHMWRADAESYIAEVRSSCFHCAAVPNVMDTVLFSRDDGRSAFEIAPERLRQHMNERKEYYRRLANLFNYDGGHGNMDDRPYHTVLPAKILMDQLHLPSVDAVNNGTDITFPPTITICGSSRFYRLAELVEVFLTHMGWMVFAFGGMDPSTLRCYYDADVVNNGIGSDEHKNMLELMWRRKILASDAIYVINKDGYIGKSVREEIDYAEKNGVSVFYMEEVQ